jgi:hypothetical protein
VFAKASGGNPAPKEAKMRVTIWAALLLCAAYASPAHSEASAPVPVGTVTAEKRPIAKALDFVGRVEAINRVEVRARVSVMPSTKHSTVLQSNFVNFSGAGTFGLCTSGGKKFSPAARQSAQ